MSLTVGNIFHCSYLIVINFRGVSRMVIPFNFPKIGASSESDVEVFQELGVINRQLSAALGWIISLGKEV